MVKYLYVPFSLAVWIFEALVMSSFHLNKPGVFAPSTIGSANPSATLASVYSAGHIILGALAAVAFFFLAAIIGSTIGNRQRRRLAYAISWAALGGILSVLVLGLARLNGVALSAFVGAVVLGAIVFGVNNGASSVISGRYGGSWINL